MIVFFFKQKTAYEMRISDWSSDVCSSDRQTAARFFRDRVVGHHSYVIGGNSEREHFGPPDRIAPFITERTCEACNSYNMLKLTRHVYGRSEEHTSELQSLMRNSTAVFCLKHKNIKTT